MIRHIGYIVFSSGSTIADIRVVCFEKVTLWPLAPCLTGTEREQINHSLNHSLNNLVNTLLTYLLTYRRLH